MSTEVAGDLVIRTAADAARYADVERVGGWLEVHAEGLELPALTSVVGWLVVHAEGLELPALTSVGGWLDVRAEGLELPALTSVGGSLDVRAEGLELPALTSVGGSLVVRAEGLELSALTSVGGWLDVRAEGLELSALTSVGGWLEVRAEGLELPALTSVGGWLEVRAEGLELPALTSVGGWPATLPPVVIADLRWVVNILDTHMSIGCQMHSLNAWAGFSSRDIAAMAQGPSAADSGARMGARYWNGRALQVGCLLCQTRRLTHEHDKQSSPAPYGFPDDVQPAGSGRLHRRD